ncbi:hypothetical protein DL546_006618 [Coniochaeta pulveracea]|uniref:Uncharacterized protein n=1 Tax=Coniochaeta pulveracea TaxID=177199 RepID=A0A420YBC1_9PEZI|nr:hypothetical protein DL546_006618 [Coniochaeta pulveracea]
MEDAHKLIAELLAKLGELDSKVASYQQDMLAQFQKYSDDLLKDVPEAISSEVSRAIAASMSKYPYLHPPSNRDDGVESEPPTPTTENWKAEGRKSPPPVLYHTSGIPKNFKHNFGEGDRSPHERENEFRGVFTPSYLPLLGDTDRPPHSSPTSLKPLPAAQAPPAGPFPPLPDSIVVNTDAAANGTARAEPRAEEPVVEEAAPRPTPVRSLTENSIHSISSSGSGSEHKIRRSALRRSSSSNKGSPRRVRFEFGGTEVLPSSSPDLGFNPSSSQTSAGLDEADNDDEINASSAIDDSELYTAESYNGLSLLDMEGEEELEPRPKKVSSTQALRELTRNNPVEEGTIWKQVNSSEDSLARGAGGSKATGISKLPAKTPMVATSHRIPGSINKPATTSSSRDESLGSPLQDMERYDAEDDDDDSSEEEFLSMPAKSSRSSSPHTRSPSGQSPVAQPFPHSTNYQKTSPESNGHPHADRERLLARPHAEDVSHVPKDLPHSWEHTVEPLLRDILKKHVKGDFSIDVHDYPELKVKSKTAPRVIRVTVSNPVSTDLQDGIQKELAKKVPPSFQETYLQFSSSKAPSSRATSQAEPDTDFFDFDDEDLSNTSGKPNKYLADEPEEDEDVSKNDEPLEAPSKPSLYSTSPAVSIPHKNQTPVTTNKTKFTDGGVGSYNGRTLRMSSVVSPKVLREAAALGDFKTFVGSVDGRSGVDMYDPFSYRESIVGRSFNGTPHSLSERMMLEDKMALEKGKDLPDDDFDDEFSSRVRAA